MSLRPGPPKGPEKVKLTVTVQPLTKETLEYHAERMTFSQGGLIDKLVAENLEPKPQKSR